ncbi:hypothetical protein GVN21_13665 [Caulobacter sp. SLTY]|uniref:hypothetical protein n=1 Tax=Caulobacter sp. SLTY TaxID=2683262 RepID=UPI001412A600|nr:hypothetical protein [Caulobacter sp. SLTY]NBB16408.1 hypothetical protein [Caulobacter sp. SLTY]
MDERVRRLHGRFTATRMAILAIALLVIGPLLWFSPPSWQPWLMFVIGPVWLGCMAWAYWVRGDLVNRAPDSPDELHARQSRRSIFDEKA